MPLETSQPDATYPLEGFLDMSDNERLMTLLTSLVMVEVALTVKWPSITTALVVAGFAYFNAGRMQQTFNALKQSVTSLLWTQPENAKKNNAEQNTSDNNATRREVQTLAAK